MAVERDREESAPIEVIEPERRSVQRIEVLPRRPRVARGSQPLFSHELLSGVSRRQVALPKAFEVAPVVASYLRQVGGAETPLPRVLEAELQQPPARWRPRDIGLLIGFALLLFVVVFAGVIAVLPR